MGEFPFVFVREGGFEKAYVEFSKRARAMIALMKRLEKHSKTFAAVDRKSIARLEEEIRRLEILLTLSEVRMISSLKGVDERIRVAVARAFSRISRDLERVARAVESGKGDVGIVEKAMEKSVRELDAKMGRFVSEIASISDRLENQSEMLGLIFRKRLESGYLVSDRDLIKTILRVRENIRKGKWRSMPEWAKDMRKEVVKELGEKILMAAEVAIVKELVKGERTEADLLKTVPVSSYTLKKALKRLIDGGHVRRSKKGRVVYYSLS